MYILGIHSIIFSLWMCMHSYLHTHTGLKLFQQMCSVCVCMCVCTSMCTCMSASVSVCGFVTEQHNDNLFIFPKIHFKVLGHNTHTQKEIYLYLKPVKAISPTHTRSPSRKCTAQRKPNRLYDIKPSIAVSGTRKVNSTAHTTREEKK